MNLPDFFVNCCLVNITNLTLKNSFFCLYFHTLNDKMIIIMSHIV